MFENKTPDVLREEILENTGIEISTVEGSFVSDMAAPIALELSKVYGEIDRALTVMFVDGAEGDYLDSRAGEYGLERKAGTMAAGGVTFSGTDGTVIPKGTIVMTEDALRYTTDEAAEIENGTAEAQITAIEVGAAYNVPAEQVVRLYRNLQGVDEVINQDPITGGTDTETDEALRGRLLVRMRTPATSGNVHHYMNWALEVNGVGAAKITPLWDGPGTVRVLVVGNNHEPVDATVVQECSVYIAEQRPIGADVTVLSAAAELITVAAEVELGNTTLEEVQAAFVEAISKYLRNIAFKEYTVSYNRIAYLLMGLEGVLDHSNLLVNNDTVNVQIGADSVPVLAEVVLSAAD